MKRSIIMAVALCRSRVSGRAALEAAAAAGVPDVRSVLELIPEKS